MAMARSLSRLVAAAFVAVAALAGSVRAELSFPPFSGYVVDKADIIPPGDERALTDKLKAFQDSTGRQLAVATVPSLQGTSVEDFGNRMFRAWGIGDGARNDGALLLVAPTERKVRIEVGYGLEGELTDAVSRLIIENAILPRFRAGDFSGGILRGADDVIAVFSGHSDDYRARAAALQQEDEASSTIVFVLVILLFLYVFWRSLRSGGGLRRRGASPWIIGGPSMGGGGWSGGSSSGGGFSGGGGGSSGGGGASGGW